MIKIKQLHNYLYNKGKIVEELKALDLKRGTYVKVISGPLPDSTNKDDILIRTSDKHSPFVDIVNGSLWGDNLAPYTFLILDEKI